MRAKEIPLLKTIYKKIIPYGLRLRVRERVVSIKKKYGLHLAWLFYGFFIRKVSLAALRPMTILFYPHLPPQEYYSIYKICRVLGYRMINNPEERFDLVINWEDCTWRSSDKRLLRLAQTYECVNVRCKDISKKRVQSLFEEVFGYQFSVNPLTFHGHCVMKSNVNSKHDGRVIECPITAVDNNYVYQKVVNNSFDDTHVEDIRVPIFKDKIPFVSLKYRLLSDRFDHYIKSAITDVRKVFNGEEVKKLILYCQKIGLDFGELDVLRDRDDGRLYIVDVNNTPIGPPRYLSLRELWLALITMAQVFEEVFISGGRFSKAHPVLS